MKNTALIGEAKLLKFPQNLYTQDKFFQVFSYEWLLANLLFYNQYQKKFS